MAYIGNEPSVNFTSFAKQDLTGVTGSPVKRGFTLTYAVANANEIEVFVNNVRQEPTEAYTVSGTALTMTGNVASTDDFYVIYLGKALQTTVPPDGSVSTAKIADDAVTSAKLDTNIAIDGDLTVDTNTLYVDSSNNRVGIGTSSPSTYGKLAIQVDGTTSPTTADNVKGSSVNLFAATNGGTTDSTVGIFGWQASQPGIGSGIGFSRESTGTWGSEIRFYTHPSATSNISDITERMRIDSSGRMLLNTTTHTNGRLNVTESLNIQPCLGLRSSYASNTGNFVLFTSDNGTGAGAISHINASTVAYNTSSDYRLKQNVTYDFDATTRLKQLQPARFSWNHDDTNTLVDGFLAHEVQSVVPEAITGNKDAVDADGNPVYQGIDQSKLVPLLVKTIQELEARITALENS